MKPHARTDIPKLLKNSDDVEIPMDPAYYRKLHDKIMMKIEENSEVTTPLPLSPPKPKVVAVPKPHSLRR